MSYARIDPILDRWAAANGLIVMTSYKEYEVRSIDLVDSQGARFQLWLDPPGETGRIGVHVWDYKKRRADYEVKLEDLADCLDEALQAASEWAGAELARR